MKKSIIPILFSKKEECCGCAACYTVCPKSAIYMYTDEQGFDYPKINQEKCIKCLQCKFICPFKEE